MNEIALTGRLTVAPEFVTRDDGESARFRIRVDERLTDFDGRSISKSFEIWVLAYARRWVRLLQAVRPAPGAEVELAGALESRPGKDREHLVLVVRPNGHMRIFADREATGEPATAPGETHAATTAPPAPTGAPASEPAGAAGAASTRTGDDDVTLELDGGPHPF